ncbi:MAG: hypothetical protein ABIL09_10535 [Gemmatimonadota bacterium]
MMKHARFLPALAVAALTAAQLAGCGTDPGPTASSPELTPAAKPDWKTGATRQCWSIGKEGGDALPEISLAIQWVRNPPGQS